MHTAGREDAIASSKAMGKHSIVKELRTKTSMTARTAATSFLAPVNTTRSRIPSSSASASNAALRGPSPTIRKRALGLRSETSEAALRNVS